VDAVVRFLGRHQNIFKNAQVIKAFDVFLERLWRPGFTFLSTQVKPDGRLLGTAIPTNVKASHNGAGCDRCDGLLGNPNATEKPYSKNQYPSMSHGEEFPAPALWCRQFLLEPPNTGAGPKHTKAR
jgi:hypothetical protein